MTGDKRFCSLENRRIDEPLPGKGGVYEPHLLLAWPRRKWTRQVFGAKDMPEAVLQRLMALRKDGWRVQLIDRRGHDHSRRRILAPMSGNVYGCDDGDLPALLDALREDAAAAAPWICGRTAPRTLICCTHGRKDRCCAKFGHASYRAICTEVARSGDDFDVWETTHVGGCRLAANVVALPAVRRYGRVDPDQVAGLLAAEREDRPYLPCFRGVPDRNALEQCADASARGWLQERGITAEVQVEPTPVPDGAGRRTVRVRWRSGETGGVLDVRCRARRVTFYSNCEDLERGETHTARFWLAEAVTAQARVEADS